MSQRPKKIQPLSVDLSNVAIDTAVEKRATETPNKPFKFTWPLLLLALAGFVVFALPQLVPDTAEKTMVANTGAQTSVEKKNSEDIAPWQDAQLARQRKAAQDSLQRLLDLQFELEEQGLATWGAQALEQVQQQAADGDGAYKARQYLLAKQAYEVAYTQLQGIKTALPQRMDSLLQIGEAALLSGDQVSAQHAFNKVLLIDNLQQRAIAGLQHAQVLPQVLELQEKAAEASQRSNWQEANSLLQQAIKLYPQYPGLQERREANDAALAQQSFDSSLGQGYTHIAAGRYAAAERSFRQALKIKPASSQARAGVEQALAEQDTRSIEQQMAKAKKQVLAEEWEAADASYRQILTIDATLKSAQQQHSLVSRRLKLDQAMQSAIADPLRLSSDSVYQGAVTLLGQAKKERPRGARLTQQISTLSDLLTQSQQLLPIALHSDGQTDVILLRQARLGRFSEKSLQLKPGKYTLLGSRDGYRDVRLAFEISPGQQQTVLTITCTEKI